MVSVFTQTWPGAPAGAAPFVAAAGLDAPEAAAGADAAAFDAPYHVFRPLWPEHAPFFDAPE
ncbi:hypothetical protein DM45_3675 [Burkholderia mallei]|nr:hypothetical protein DM53_4420 [Burkholderia mallei]KOS93919.1 hypothetical protein DM45_3675 [Burkholderia mallei]KOT22006.1 hypothetical protein DM52_2232 [Burkholderia mallei]